MKKGFVTFVVISMVVLLAACGSSGGDADSAAGEQDTETYLGMSFACPSGSEYSEEDGYAYITIVSSDKYIFIYPQKISEDGADSYRQQALSSFMSAFDDVTDTESYDLTIDGLDAVGERAVVDYNGWHLYCELAFVYNGESGYFYTIEYTSTTDTEEDTSLYEAFTDSISFE